MTELDFQTFDAASNFAAKDGGREDEPGALTL